MDHPALQKETKGLLPLLGEDDFTGLFDPGLARLGLKKRKATRNCKLRRKIQLYKQPEYLVG
jgi:hypothetical protein